MSSLSDYPLHCGFDEGLLRACSRIRFNKYYQVAGEFELAFQVDSNNGRPSMSVSSDVTSLPQRGVATIIPHAFSGESGQPQSPASRQLQLLIDRQ